MSDIFIQGIALLSQIILNIETFFAMALRDELAEISAFAILFSIIFSFLLIKTWFIARCLYFGTRFAHFAKRMSLLLFFSSFLSAIALFSLTRNYLPFCLEESKIDEFKADAVIKRLRNMELNNYLSRKNFTKILKDDSSATFLDDITLNEYTEFINKGIGEILKEKYPNFEMEHKILPPSELNKKIDEKICIHHEEVVQYFLSDTKNVTTIKLKLSNYAPKSRSKINFWGTLVSFLVCFCCIVKSIKIGLDNTREWNDIMNQ